MSHAGDNTYFQLGSYNSLTPSGGTSADTSAPYASFSSHGFYGADAISQVQLVVQVSCVCPGHALFVITKSPTTARGAPGCAGPQLSALNATSHPHYAPAAHEHPTMCRCQQATSTR